MTRERSTSATPSEDPHLPDGGTSSVLRRTRRALLGAAGLAVVGLAAHNVRRIDRLRKDAPNHRVELDHRRVVGEGTGEPLRLVVLGDSAADGFGVQHPRQAFPYHLASHLSTATARRVDVTSLARDGATTEDVLLEQVPLVKAAQPDVVVVSVGVNDAIRRRRKSELERTTLGVLSQLHDAVPQARFVLVGCPDLSPAPAFAWPSSVVVGYLCRRVASIQRRIATEAGVAYADLSDTSREDFSPDGFHPGPRGQAAAARVTVATLLAEGDTAPPRRRRIRRNAPWSSGSRLARSS